MSDDVLDLNSTLDDILKEFELDTFEEQETTEDVQEDQVEEQNNEETTEQEQEQVQDVVKEEETNTNEVQVDEREQQFNKLNEDNVNLRKEIEELKRREEQHKALEKELNQIKEIAKEKNVDLTKSDYDITIDDIKRLEEDYPEQGKMIRALYKKIEKMQTNQSNNVQQEQQYTNQNDIVNEVNLAIDKVPELRLWSDYRNEYSKEWELATKIDNELQNKPEWSNKPIADRFKEVLKLTKAELYKKKVDIQEVVDNAKLETPSSPSMLNGSVVQSDDRLQRFKNMSENDILSGALSNSDIEYIWDHL